VYAEDVNIPAYARKTVVTNIIGYAQNVSNTDLNKYSPCL